MKTNAWIIALTALAIVSCNSQKKATTYVDDDVYLSSSPPAKVVVAPAPHPAAQGEQIVVSPDEAKAQKPASSTLEEDYNDYSYADRINRFNNKDTTVGYFEQSSSGSSGSYGNNGPDVNLYFGAGYGYGGYYGPSYSFGMGGLSLLGMGLWMGLSLLGISLLWLSLLWILSLVRPMFLLLRLL